MQQIGISCLLNTATSKILLIVCDLLSSADCGAHSMKEIEIKKEEISQETESSYEPPASKVG